jgi:ribose transport system permease protein
MTTVLSTLAGRPRLARLGRRHAWTAAVVVLLVLLLLWQRSLTRGWGAFELQTIATSTLALAFAAAAQAIVVLTAGIDLSVGAQMVLLNCLSARLMAGQSFATCLAIAALTLAVGVVIGALNGLLVSLLGIPDIIVTLATSFVLTGVTLLVMPNPGGGTAERFQELVNGTGTAFLPALLCLAIPLVLIWVPLRRHRLGLSIYALGSSREASYLAGVDARRTKVFAYALAGLLCGFAGLASTAYTGGGQPATNIGTLTTLTSVAAVVLGGVALSGGVGGLFGPIVAVWCLYLIPSIMLSLGVDPSYGEVVKGVVLVLVVLVGGVLRMRWRSA